MSTEGTLAWRTLWVETSERVGSAQEGRWLCQEASGLSGADWALGLDEPATVRAVARLDAMVARRLVGEPLQYVLGSWPFRRLELFVDRRVLIPRPETEHVVGVALELAAGLPRPLVAVDLGTGSGAIGLSLAVELRGEVIVWCTDASADALDVARANLTGCPGMAAARVRMAEGSWYDALPDDLRGTVGLVVANPPYVAADEDLPPEVRDWEPTGALVSGPTGLEAIESVVEGAVRWLRPGGLLVVEIGATQGAAVARLAERAGLVDVGIRPDLAGLDRMLVARRS